MRRRWLPGLLALALLAPAVVAPMATASARAVVADYFADGRLNGAYSIDELRAALVFAQRHQARSGQYSAFADAVNQAITESLVGAGGGAGEAAQGQLTVPRSRTEVAPAPVPPSPPAPPSGLPTPPAGAPATSMPLAMTIIAIAAGVLLLAGIGASIWRRLRR